LWPPLLASTSVGTTEQSAIFIIIDGHGNNGIIIIIIIIAGSTYTERMDHASKNFSHVVSTVAPLVSND
jgi:glycosylphosphatidylinositol transamidase (GPIT) subunit GPI8